MAPDHNTVARALWYVAPGHAELREETLAPPQDGMARVRARYGAISRGTESLVFAGRVPQSEHKRMRGPFMAGEFPFPVKYGYAVVGRVEAGPRELQGRDVFALHPHQDRFDIPAVSAVPLPEGVAPERAVLAANMETALNAVWDAAPRHGDRIAVVGAGVVGALVGYLCLRTVPEVEVTLIDINPARAEVARALGVQFAAPETAPTECDLVVHASATAAGLAAALNLARDEATVLELSWYGAGEVPVPLGGAFHSRRLKLVSSQVGKVAPSHRASWTPRARLEAALAFTADPRLDVLFAPAVKFAELPARLPEIFQPNSGILCQRIDY
ncbi:MAG TPA: zinc-binding alcohol dehydrogenase [Xanthobacteraceae bacterium]|nr:zinc-binding alcohol dehydrogenase [Xanthobacteraceae bacterium]